MLNESPLSTKRNDWLTAEKIKFLSAPQKLNAVYANEPDNNSSTLPTYDKQCVFDAIHCNKQTTVLFVIAIRCPCGLAKKPSTSPSQSITHGDPKRVQWLANDSHIFCCCLIQTNHEPFFHELLSFLFAHFLNNEQIMIISKSSHLQGMSLAWKYFLNLICFNFAFSFSPSWIIFNSF